ncbi:MAG: major outer membrane protein [Akkermansiaceae bacterium]|nr:major outer membrane protein [Akkermansiaceae bacterium]
MKSQLLLIALITPVIAQEPLPRPGTAVEKTVTETVTPDGQRTVEETVVAKPAVPVAPPAPAVVAVAAGFDPARRLAIVPRAIPVAPPAAPGTRTETTETTTTQVGGRVYNTERSVVVFEGRELPYVTVPVLFVRETAELLDSQSRAALDQTAAAITAVIGTDPNASFQIEGHTSTEGTDDFNMTLSQARAQRIYDELTQRYHISPGVLTARGYGEMYPAYPNGNETQLTLDRRVLVVRTR